MFIDSTLLIIGLVLIFLIGCIIGYLSTNKKTKEKNIKIEEENNELIKLKEENIKKYQDSLIEQSQKKEILIKEVEEEKYKAELEKNKIWHDVELARENYEKSLILQIELRKKDIEVELNKYKAIEIENTNMWIEEELIKILNKTTELEKEKSELEKVVEELKTYRAAAISAQKREEEIANQQEFFKINLKENDSDDIKTLRSIEKYLFNKEPLYKVIWSTYYQTPLNDLIGRVIGKNTKCGIYKITNLKNKKVYIGQSVNISERWKQHVKSSLEIGTIAKNQLYTAMKEFGAESFSFEIIEECCKEELNKKEKNWIDVYESSSYGYNMKG